MYRLKLIVKNISLTLFTALLLKGILILISFLWPRNLLDFYRKEYFNHEILIDYAPEVWLSLLGLVLGTLIIVISIAAESTPKLIDLFITDARSRLFIWLIALSIVENIFLQPIKIGQSIALDNLIFFNNYLLLPLFSIIAIPYVYYILSYTKDSNVIRKIYEENIRAIKTARHVQSPQRINNNHRILFDTINQLNDLQQYIQFKEPKGSVVLRMGRSLRFYLKQKQHFKESYFKLSPAIKDDVSFKMLVNKFENIERSRTFYEQKTLSALGTSYLLLLKNSHYDLASLCGNELLECGKIAANQKDRESVDLILNHFNTFIRYGINHGFRNREVRNVYNTIFHYSQLIDYFIKIRESDNVMQCFKYFAFYHNEVTRLCRAEVTFAFLADAFTGEMKKILCQVYANLFNLEYQEEMIDKFNGLDFVMKKRSIGKMKYVETGNSQLIQIALCLFYLSKNEDAMSMKVMETLISDLKYLNGDQAESSMVELCNRLREQTQNFWEESDLGNHNIFFSPHVSQIPDFIDKFRKQLHHHSIVNR